MKKSQMLKALTRAFPQFGDKEAIKEYYCNYDVPQKQAHLLKFWGKVILFMNQLLAGVVMSQNHLSQLLEVYGLKPLPIRNVLLALAKEQRVYSIGDLGKVYGGEGRSNEDSKGFFRNIISYFYQSNKAVQLENKIFFKAFVDTKLLESHLCLRAIFKGVSVQEEDFVLEKLGTGLQLNKDVSSILDILEWQHRLQRVEVDGTDRVYRVVVYPGEGREITRELIELQKLKFGLRLRAELITSKINDFNNKSSELASKAKVCFSQGNIAASKNLLKENVILQKHLAGMVSRKRLLTQKLTQIEQTEMNNNLISIITASQDILRKTMVDHQQLNEMRATAQSFRFSQAHTHNLCREMAGDNSQEDNLYQQLEAEVLEGLREMQVDDFSNTGRTTPTVKRSTQRYSTRMLETSEQ